MNIVTEMYRTMLDIIAGMIGAESAPEEFIESLTYLMRVLNNPLLIVSFDGYIMRYVLHHKHIRRVNRFIYKAIAERRAVKAKREKIGGVTRTMLDILLDVEGEDGRMRKLKILLGSFDIVSLILWFLFTIKMAFLSTFNTSAGADARLKASLVNYKMEISESSLSLKIA
ncbi:hypothetical protein BC938DRAFT_471551 [Jimgerdemannia flammicorona]|uniref:Uncharacterized protein n=1 Tax=Jimgerdemannia flammicorona TaxID=994334 RepID=A0A433Q7W1_9FUNG|nr:hypothetical protein BC938DRAFT_471551 [Jimgerdemannia flammicorona]